jgi:hypothetical protein
MAAPPPDSSLDQVRFVISVALVPLQALVLSLAFFPG